MSELKRARQLTAIIGVSSPSATPSPKLRRRILAAVGLEQRRFGWAPFLGLATALSLFAAFYFSTRERQFANQTVSLRDQLRRQTIELTRLNEAFAILGGPSTIEAGFGPGARGRVYVDRTRGVVLIANNLPPAPAGKIYEMWTIAKGAKPVPAGLFQSEPSGAALHLQAGPVDANVNTVAVTLEPDSGSLAPTTVPLLAVTLP